MKKYIIIAIILVAGFSGLISYGLARPLDELQMKKINADIADIRNASSTGIVDLSAIKASNRLVAGEVLPDSKLYGMKMFGEKLRLYFSRTEKETQRLKVIFLNRRLAEAEALLEDGKSGQARQLVNKFAKGSEELRLELKKQEFLRLDPNLATDMENAMSGQIELQKKLMIDVSSSSPLFVIKSKLLDLEMQMADTPEEKKSVREEQANEAKLKIISTVTTKEAGRPNDWQIFKGEAAIVSGRVGRVFEKQLQMASDSIRWAKAETLRLFAYMRK